MNRTNEFVNIVLSFNTPQIKQPAILHKIPLILLKSSKMYDTSKLKSIPLLNYKPKSLQDEKVQENINDEIKRLIRFKAVEMQKLYDKNKKSKKIHNEDTTNTSSPTTAQSSMQDVMLLEEQEITQRNVNVQERERIEEQINELGQIMCDITMHVEAQGEKLKRIDDATLETEDFLKKSYYEINRTWERIKGRREMMLKYFIFWLFVCLILYIIKKIF